MAKLWKYVIILAVILLAFGALLAGAGLITGASAGRVTTALDLAARLEAVRQNLAALPLVGGFF